MPYKETCSSDVYIVILCNLEHENKIVGVKLNSED